MDPADIFRQFQLVLSGSSLDPFKYERMNHELQMDVIQALSEKVPVIRTRCDAQSLEAYDKILRALSKFGYHRARVEYLSNHDKVIGGLTWLVAKVQHMQPTNIGDPNDTDAMEWTFEETKDDEVKSPGLQILECAELLDYLRTVKWPKNKIALDKLTTLSPIQLGTILGPATFKFRTLENEPSSYPNLDKFTEFTGVNEFEAGAFLERLVFLPNSMREWHKEHWLKWDFAIVYDENISARQIMAEYLNYAKTGSRIYPDHYAAVMDRTFNLMLQRRECPPGQPHFPSQEIRDALDHLGNGFYTHLPQNVRDLFDIIEPAIREVAVANTLNGFFLEFYDEAMAFHRLQGVDEQFHEELGFLKDATTNLKVPKTQPVRDNIQPFYQREARLLCAFEIEMRELQVQREKAQYQRQPDGTMEKVHPCLNPVLTDLSAKHIALSVKMDKITSHMNGLRKHFKLLEHNRKRFRQAKRTRFPLIPESQCTGFFLEVIEHLPTRIDKKADEVYKIYKSQFTNDTREIIDGFMAYMSDARNCATDMANKAKLFHKYRLTHKQGYEQAEYCVKTSKKQIKAIRKMYDEINTINQLLARVKGYFDEFEAESPVFQKMVFRKQENPETVGESSENASNAQ